MCGIVGYIGKKEALPIITEGLKRLEYRGYDSAGVVILNKEASLVKVKGRVKDLTDKLDNKNIIGNYGIGHTRWATHGEPSEINAHPHCDCKKEIFVVHNGIIENYVSLRERLIEKGHKFVSETDTEVIAHLIEEFFDGNLEEAVRLALKEIMGAYAIAVVSLKDPNKIVFTRKSSPLLIGLGQDENFIASDAPAILGNTKRVIYLEDNELGVITANDFKIIDLENNKIQKEVSLLEWNIEEAEKKGYPHFMFKEIMEEGDAIRNVPRGRVVLEEGAVKFGGLEHIENKLRDVERLTIIAMGTAYLAGFVGKYMLEEYAQMPVMLENASEFRYKKSIIDKNSAVIAVSQSGETADTLFAVKEAKRQGALTLGIINVVGSSIAREVDAGIYNHAGPEIGVASTKAFVSQIAVFALLSVFLGRQRGMSLIMGKRIIEELSQIPSLIEKIFQKTERIKELAEKYYKHENFFYLGRKYNYPIALEGALKLKEISYIHAEGYQAGEMKHGPIAMIDENFPSICIVPKDSVYEKNFSGIQEIKARKGKIIAITTEENNELNNIVDDCLFIPKTLEMLTPLLSVIPLQLFAYYVAVLRGNDIDKPRNLAKSVTVE
ncbi:MAG: glutamine--fructose-6-phosphate transaminase (isomerizing) [Candidatus Parcubacteria bacterium]|nr:glutamine--fructose-6-phosphate transaminase (isomerizing) [Candidatus Parcubacteria bacterium]